MVRRSTKQTRYFIICECLCWCATTLTRNPVTIFTKYVVHLFVQYKSIAANIIRVANIAKNPIANTIIMVSIIAAPLVMVVTWVQMGLYT